MTTLDVAEKVLFIAFDLSLLGLFLPTDRSLRFLGAEQLLQTVNHGLLLLDLFLKLFQLLLLKADAGVAVVMMAVALAATKADASVVMIGAALRPAAAISLVHSCGGTR